MKLLGDRINDLRLEKGITQLELAKYLYIKRNTLSQYENNRRIPSIDTIKKIANYFNTSIEYVLGVTDLRISPTDKKIEVFLNLFVKLKPTDQEEIIAHMRRLKED